MDNGLNALLGGMMLPEASQANVLPEGSHKVIVESMIPQSDLSKNADWDDETISFKTRFRCKDGGDFDGHIFTEYIKPLAFKRWDDLTEKEKSSGKYREGVDQKFGGKVYAVVVKTNKRVPDAVEKNGKIVAGEHTMNAMQIISNLAKSADLDPTKLTVDQLRTEIVGKEIGIVIKQTDTGKLEAKTFYNPRKSTAPAKRRELVLKG